MSAAYTIGSYAVHALSNHRRAALRTGVGFILFLICFSESRAQITGVHGISERDSIMSFDDIRRLPRDTTRRYRQEPEEEGNFVPTWTPEPGARIHREEHPAPRQRGRQAPGSYTPLSPAPNSNFTGTSDITVAIPPDVQGAAGSNYLVQMENEQTEILTKTGTAHSTVGINSFWTSMSPSSCYDSRIRYDPYAQRWIAITDDYAESSSSCFYIAVSTTSDPTGTWQFHKIRADSTSTWWLDFPELGFNKNWIVVTGNMFTISGNNFSRSYLWAFDKSSLYSNTVSYTRMNLSSFFTMQPATTYDSTESSEFMMVGLNSNSALLGLYYLSGNFGSETLNLASYVQGSVDWAFSPDSTNSAPQKSSTKDIDLDDARMQSVVYRNGYVWCVHNAFLPSSNPTRCSVQWWQVDTLGDIIQRNLIDDSVGGISYAYPSICVNSYNDAMIGYSSFSSGQYASSDYSFRYACDTLSTLESDYIYKSGANTYFQEAGGTANRWGDYSGTMVDPSDDETFWTLQEYATSTQNNWGTWWAKVTPTHNANGGSGTWTWTGERSTSWFEACNWDKGSLPNASSDVVIPGGTTYSPNITGAASCNTITIATANGGVIKINDSGGGSLTVSQ